MAKKFFYFSVFFLLHLLLLFIFSFSISAGGCLDKNCSGSQNCGCQRYRVEPGETITVYEHEICQRVGNQSGYPPIFIPTNTLSEWSSFCIHRPSHVSCLPCPTPTPSPTPSPSECSGDLRFYIIPNPVRYCAQNGLAERPTFVIEGLSPGCEGYGATVWEYNPNAWGPGRGGWIYVRSDCIIGPHGGCKATMGLNLPSPSTYYTYGVGIYTPSGGSPIMWKTNNLYFEGGACRNLCSRRDLWDCCDLQTGRYCYWETTGSNFQWSKCLGPVQGGNCYSLLGNCCTSHPETVGCEKPLCAKCVCETLGSSYCCSAGWDAYCASQARQSICSFYCQCS